jgi:putative flippase GtrA
MGFIPYVKFFISYIPNFIIQTIIVWLFDAFTAFPAISAYITAAIIGIPVTFILMKIFAFKKK